MIERWCAWHKPEPKLLEVIDDGHLAVIRTDGICHECVQEIQRAEQARIRRAAAGPTSFLRRAPLLGKLCKTSPS